MNKNLKEILRTAKNLHRKGLIYLEDNIEARVEVNYQVIAAVVEGLNIFIDEKRYDLLKNDKEELLHELAFSSFGEDDLISDIDIEFKENIIKEFIYIDDPELIDGKYFFITNYEKLQRVYEKALIRIEEGKFKNYIF